MSIFERERERERELGLGAVRRLVRRGQLSPQKKKKKKKETTKAYFGVVYSL